MTLKAHPGNALSEYGLILSLIALACMASVSLLGGNIRSAFIQLNVPSISAPSPQNPVSNLPPGYTSSKPKPSLPGIQDDDLPLPPDPLEKPSILSRPGIIGNPIPKVQTSGANGQDILISQEPPLPVKKPGITLPPPLGDGTPAPIDKEIPGDDYAGEDGGLCESGPTQNCSTEPDKPPAP